MSNLIERLRYAAMTDHQGYPGVKVAGEAADEIERLQSKLVSRENTLRHILHRTRDGDHVSSEWLRETVREALSDD